MLPFLVVQMEMLIDLYCSSWVSLRISDHIIERNESNNSQLFDFISFEVTFYLVISDDSRFLYKCGDIWQS